MVNENFRDLLIRTLTLSDELVADLGVPMDYKRQAWDTLNQSVHRFLRQPEISGLLCPDFAGLAKQRC